MKKGLAARVCRKLSRAIRAHHQLYLGGTSCPGFSRTAAAPGWKAAAVCLLVLTASRPAVGQLILPPAALPPCPAAGNPCVSITYPHIENDFILNQFQARLGHAPDPVPIFSPAEYYNVQFDGIGTSYSIKNGSYVGWSTFVNEDVSSVGPYLLFDPLFARLPPAPWNNFSAQYAAATWLLNNKPPSVTYQTGCDQAGTNCTGTATTNDARTIRDEIQQVIWMLFNNGTPYCCSLTANITGDSTQAPTDPQYNATFVADALLGNSGGGYNISAAVNTLYHQALTHTGYLPGPSGLQLLFVLDSTGILVEIPPPLPTLTIVKSPKNGTFLAGGQVSFSIVVTNTAASGGPSATNVTVTDPLPTAGGLTWGNPAPTQGTCSITANVLSCSLGTLAPQASVTINLTSQTPTPLAACQLQNNTATVSATGIQPVSDTGSQTCTPPAGLQLVKSSGTFLPGGQPAFTITVSCSAGGSACTNVTIADPLPTNGGLTWTSYTTAQGTCTLVSNVLHCALGTLAPGGSTQVTVSSPASTPLSACQSQPNPAAVASGDNLIPVTASGLQSCICPPHLNVQKTPKGSTFLLGGQATFTILVGNSGCPNDNGAATNVVLTDSLPTNGGLTWTSFTTTQGTCSLAANVLNCSLGTIPGGGLVTITVSSPAVTPASACQLQNNPAATATATNAQPASDSGSLTCDPPTLKVVKSPKNGIFFQGGQTSFSIVVSNPSPAGGLGATNVVLADTLPTAGGLTWTSFTTTQGTCTLVSNVLSCSLGTIAAGSSATVTVFSPLSTPASACQAQNNPAANATADLGLTATDFGSLYCTQTPPTPPCDGPFQIRYAANLDVGESFVTMGNDGVNGASATEFGGASGNVCVNVYALDPSEELISCCSCLITPNQVRYLRVRQDMLSNVAGGVVPSSVAIKLVSTLAGPGGSGTSCANSAATVSVDNVVSGLVAWGTTLHSTPITGAYATTETRFVCGTLNRGELSSLANRCAAMIGDLGGFGICGLCRPLP